MPLHAIAGASVITVIRRLSIIISLMDLFYSFSPPFHRAKETVEPSQRRHTSFLLLGRCVTRGNGRTNERRSLSHALDLGWHGMCVCVRSREKCPVGWRFNDQLIHTNTHTRGIHWLMSNLMQFDSTTTQQQHKWEKGSCAKSRGRVSLAATDANVF